MGEGETYRSCRESSPGKTEAQSQEATCPGHTVGSGDTGSHFGVPWQCPSVTSSLKLPLFLWRRRFHGNPKAQDSQAVPGEGWGRWALDRKDPAEDSGSVHRADTLERLFFPFEGLPWWLSW